MLVKTLATRVNLGQKFYYRGRTYVLATAEERKRHPADQRKSVLAYQIADNGDRMPVGISPLVEVFVDSC